tara:strand:+ start:300 stop:863 length:564 start_codon:yes stop_codon:yes gene_type:complete
MKKFITTSLLLLLGAGICQAQRVATNPKVVAVDIEIVLTSYKKFQDAKKKLDASKENAQDEIEILKGEGKALIDKAKALEANIRNPALNPTAQAKYKKEFDDLRRQIQQKERDLLAYIQRTDAVLKQRLKSILELHMGEIRDMVTLVAKEKGADLALNKSLKDFVIYSADYFDITQDVLTRLNASAK